jgi:type IV pilus assembly protein PilO
MIGARANIWQQRLAVWVPALGFLVINCIGLLVYEVGYANRVRTLQLDLRDQDKELAAASAERQQREDLLRQAHDNREHILQLYNEHFSTRRRRLTGVTAEVQDLARRAGLVPRAISYPEEQIQQYGLIKRSFVFSVDGTYADLRKFINLLEVSDSFLTLEDIALNEAGPRAGGPGGPGGRPTAAPALGGAPVTSLPQPPGPPQPQRPGFPTPSSPPVPAAASPPAPGSSSVLHMAMTISTLFATRVEPRDPLAPLPGVNAGAAAGGSPPRGGSPP